MRHAVFVAVLPLIVALMGAPHAKAMGVDDYVGSIELVPLPFCPSGTIEAAGQEFSAQHEQALYTLFENRFGGSQKSSKFNVPDLRGTAPTGMRYCLQVRGAFPRHP